MAESIKLGSIFAEAELRLGPWEQNFRKIQSDIRTLGTFSAAVSPRLNTQQFTTGMEGLRRSVTGTLSQIQTQFRVHNAQQAAQAQASARQIVRAAQDEQTGILRAVRDRISQEKNLTAGQKLLAIREAQDRAKQVGRAAQDESRAVLAASREQTAQIRAQAAERTRVVREAATELKRIEEQQKRASEQRGQARQQVGQVALGAAAAGGAAATGEAIAAVRATARYDDTSRYTATNLRLNPSQLQRMEQDVSDVSKDRRIRATPTALQEGLYDITGTPRYAGQPGTQKYQNALRILRLGGWAAAAEGTDPRTALDAPLAALNTGIKGAETPEKVFDTILIGAQSGKMEPKQLTGLGSTFEGVKSMGGNLQDMMAAMAMLTVQGQSVGEASAAIREFIKHVKLPSVGARQGFAALNMPVGATAFEQVGGIVPWLEMLNTRSDAYAKQFGRIQVARGRVIPAKTGADIRAALFPEMQSEVAASILSGKGDVKLDIPRYRGFREMMERGGALREANTMMTEGPAAAMDRLAKSFERLQISLGKGITPAMEAFAGWIEWLIARFDKLSPQGQANVGTGIAVAGGVLSTGATIGGGVMTFKGAQNLFRTAFGKTPVPGGGGAGTNLAAPRSLGAALLRGMGGIAGTAAEGGLGAAAMIGAPIALGGAVLKHYNDMYADAVNEEAKATEGYAGMPAPGFQQRWQSLRQGPGIGRLIPAIQAAAKRYGVDPRLIASVIHNETNGQGSQYINRANRDGSVDYGVMQVNSKTLKEQFGIDHQQYYRSGAYANDDLNIMMGTAELAAKIRQSGGNVWEGVRRYNGGGPASYAYQKRAMDYFSGLSGQAFAAPSPATTPAAGPADNFHFLAPPDPNAKRNARSARLEDEARASMVGDPTDPYDREFGAINARYRHRINQGMKQATAMELMNREMAAVNAKREAAEAKAADLLRRQETAEARKDLIAYLKGENALGRMGGGMDSAGAALSSGLGGIFGGLAEDQERLFRYNVDNEKIPTATALTGIDARVAKQRTGSEEWVRLMEWRRSVEQRQQREQDTLTDFGRGTDALGESMGGLGNIFGQGKAASDKRDDKESARMFRAEWGGALRGVEGGFTHLWETAIGGHKRMGNAWKQVMDEMKQIGIHTVAAILAKWSMLQLVGGGKIGTPGASGAGLLSGLFGGGGGGLLSGLGGLGSLFGGLGGLFGGGHGRGVAQTPDFVGPKNTAGGGGGAGGIGGIAGMIGKGGLLHLGGALGGVGAALPWVGGGLLLNNLLGNPIGKVFKGIKKFFHFDDPVNDRKAQRWGLDFAKHFTTGAQSHVDRMEALSGGRGGRGAGGGGGGLGGNTVNLHHYGDINNMADADRLKNDLAWHIQANLDTVNPSGIRRQGETGG